MMRVYYYPIAHSSLFEKAAYDVCINLSSIGAHKREEDGRASGLQQEWQKWKLFLID